MIFVVYLVVEMRKIHFCLGVLKLNSVLWFLGWTLTPSGFSLKNSDALASPSLWQVTKSMWLLSQSLGAFFQSPFILTFPWHHGGLWCLRKVSGFYDQILIASQALLKLSQGMRRDDSASTRQHRKKLDSVSACFVRAMILKFPSCFPDSSLNQK